MFLEKLEGLSQGVTLSTGEGFVTFSSSPVSLALLPSAAYFLSASVDCIQSAQRAGPGGGGAGETSRSQVLTWGGGVIYLSRQKSELRFDVRSKP